MGLIKAKGGLRRRNKVGEGRLEVGEARDD